MKNFTTRMGFEPTRAELNGLAIQQLTTTSAIILRFSFRFQEISMR